MVEGPHASGGRSKELRSPAAKRTLLIVDGSTDAMVAKLLSTAPEIARLGVECVAVHTAADARAAVERDAPVMIVLDPAMFAAPSADFEQLRALAADASLVLLANGDTHAENIEACYRAGADDCLMRPFRAAHLTARLAAILEAPSATAQAAAARSRAPSVRVLLIGAPTPVLRRSARFLQLSGYHVLTLVPGAADLALRPGTEGPDLVLLFPDAVEAAGAVAAAVAGPPGALRAPVVALAAPPAAGVSPGVAAWFDEGAFGVEQVVGRVNAHFHRTSEHLRVPQRVPFFCPVELREIGDPDARWTSCYSYDLSPGGLFVKTLVPPRPRASVELRIYLTAARQIFDGTGVVAWSNPYARRQAWSYPVGAGVQFLGMSPKRLGQLRELCAELSSSEEEEP